MGIGVSSNVVAAAASLISCSILTAPFHYLGVKVPIGVLNHLESIRHNFFYRVDGSYRKLAWIGWNMDLTLKKNGGALDTHKLIPRRSPWQDVILAIHSLQSKEEVALKFLYKRLYALEMCKSISVAKKMGHPSLSHSFRRMPKGGVKQENYGLLCSKVADLTFSNISNRWTKIDIREIIFNKLIARLNEVPRKKHMSYPRFIECVLVKKIGAKRVRGGNTLTIPLPFEEEQVELKLFSKQGLGGKLNKALREDKRLFELKPVPSTKLVKVVNSW
nr:hypothetical protein [Tanacetum cinerariifolium]